MSQENVEFIRGVLEANQDPEVLALLATEDSDLSWVDPDVEWDASRIGELIPDVAEVFHGHEGVRTYWRRWLEAWSNLEYEVEDVLDAGDDEVVLIHNQRQWGLHTGIVTEMPAYAMVFTMRDGRLVRWRTFPSHAEALEEVGVRQG